jgi:hypothetical protein
MEESAMNSKLDNFRGLIGSRSWKATFPGISAFTRVFDALWRAG